MKKKFIKKGFVRFNTLLNDFFLKRKLIKQKKPLTIKEYYWFAKKFLNAPIPFWQVEEEICPFLEFVKKRKPKVILEIGTAGGGSLFMLAKIASNNARIISIDLPEGKFGGGYPKSRISIYKAFAKGKQKIELIRGNSQSQETLQITKSCLNGELFDLIFIDGDHSYEGVKSDFENYSKLLNKNGIIAFHDIVPGPIENVGEVPKFWSEIKKGKSYVEFVENWDQGGYGIGVLQY